MTRRMLTLLLVSLISICCFAVISNANLNPSYSEKAVIDTVPFYPNGTYDASVPNPDDYLAEPIGFWPMRYHEMASYIKLLAEKSDRVQLKITGKSHENRDLFTIFIGLPENIQKLKEIQANSSKLASPDQLKNDTELNAHIESIPAIAWLGYSIHGGEISGVDAGIRLAYQLAAGTDSATMHLLENVLIIIDPIENPDGRERYLSMLEIYRSHVPNFDRHAQQHSGVWPWGRGNHYLFDLNRDWILLTQPESQKRTREILDWHPQIVVDAHEMGSNATYLFSPPRQPINYNTPDNVYKWWDIFSKDQGAAFDKNGWPYYVREWHEQWYPGYGSAWPTFFGTIGILYEQSGVDGTFVQQRNGYLMTYHESVNHQFTSSLANLFTLANNRKEILKDYHNSRKQIVANGKKSNFAFLFEPDSDEIKMQKFIESLAKQDIIIEQAQNNFTVSKAKDIYLKEHTSKKFPKGTYIIRTAQTQGALAKAILEFDPHFKYQFLKDERREIEKYNETKMYEVTSWSSPLAYNLSAFETNSTINVATKQVSTVELSTGTVLNPDAQFGFIVDMEGEKTYQILNKLFGEQIIVYASEKPFAIEGRDYKAGALVIRTRGNDANLVEKLSAFATDVGINVYGVNTGTASKGSFLGASTYHLLTQPKIALLTGPPLNFTSFGSLWFTIDKQLELPHSLINTPNLAYSDLTKYNVLIMPSSWGNTLPSILGNGGKRKIEKWVSNGGTLIAVGASAVWAADSTTGLSQVKLKRQALKELSKYADAVERDQNAEAPVVDTMALYHPEKVLPKEAKEENGKNKSPSDKKAEELDKWQRRFMPRGTFFKTELDTENWLTFGLDKTLPVQLYTDYAFLAQSPVQTAVRLTTDKNNLRLSGLLWPESRERWAGTAYLTRESHGKGQIILFAGEPNSRAYFYGSRQLFINAVMFGPGFGSRFEGPYNQEQEQQ